jgi:DNA-binding CsgD family transcriptional regulator
MLMPYRWRPPKTHLSPREQEILKLAAQGQRVNQIACTLWLSPRTVRNHLKSAYRILRASDLAEALLKAIGRGDIPLPSADSTAGQGEGKV